jgi:hypothetical protein
MKEKREGLLLWKKKKKVEGVVTYSVPVPSPRIPYRRVRASAAVLWENLTGTMHDVFGASRSGNPLKQAPSSLPRLSFLSLSLFPLLIPLPFLTFYTACDVVQQYGIQRTGTMEGKK